uniref:beta'' subunit of RNA polymerase n=1 Tax=Calidiella yingdensis TaxID=3031288 RepID=UPI0024114BBB|nr:beta'' subunit of RNA polymerase [Calidiella yingdensis]WDY13099.1 beta'' subunit of RNA polymerase [Calidiella yingdensis]
MTRETIFFNQVFDKKRLKVLIGWVLEEFGEKQALRVVEELKKIGFSNATQAGLSIGVADLSTPIQKASLMLKAEYTMTICDVDFNAGRITATERSQRIVDTWHRVSETLRKQVVDHFSTYDQLNPVYIMALSGARGNFSQVRQLVGMRGLMADPQGQIISFPIRSNLREGLTLTEYFISCSGARKGLVDTALRTADTGYLTRRLVDVAHHIVIKKVDCNTNRGLLVRALKSENKTLLSLRDRLIGRVLAQDIEYVVKTHNHLLANKNQEICPTLASQIQEVKDQVFIRSPLTCALPHSVCQLCYGWSLSQGRLVSLGEAVGVIAAQSIGEPGTQLTMRTFHTGGVFSGDLLHEIRAPHSGRIEFPKAYQGLMIRTTDGQIAFITKTPGEVILQENNIYDQAITAPIVQPSHKNLDPGKASDSRGVKKQTCLQFQALSLLFVRQSEYVRKNQLLAQISLFGEEGNQPIKTRQTIFAELSGKVFETQGAVNNKRFIKNIKKLNPSSETDISESEIVEALKARAYDSIQPEKSTKLGFFNVLATQIGATFNSSQFPFQEYNSIPTISHLGVIDQYEMSENNKVVPRFSEAQRTDTKRSLNTGTPNFAFGQAKSSEQKNSQIDKSEDISTFSKSLNLSKRPFGIEPLRLHLSESQSQPLSRRVLTLHTRGSDKIRRGQTNSTFKMRSLQLKCSYNPYTTQFFSSTKNKNLVASLVKKRIHAVNRCKSLPEITPYQKLTESVKNKLHTGDLYLRTIAQEGDLVDSNYSAILNN